MLRGFYALEQHPHGVLHPVRDRRDQHRARGRCSPATSPRRSTAPGLVIAYAGSYLVGAAHLVLAARRHVLGGLETPRLLRFLVRLLIAAGIADGRRLGRSRCGLQQVWPRRTAGRSQSVVRPRHHRRWSTWLVFLGRWPGCTADHRGDQRHGPGHRSPPAVTARP